MTEGREKDLLRHVPTLGTLAEARAFRAQLAEQGEQMAGRLYAALAARMDYLARKEGVRA